jgi:hypothetical protein
LSQGSLAKKATTLSIPLASLKFPPITSISYSASRAKDWDDILTGHTDETFARTWTMQSKKLGKHSLGFADAVKGKSKERTVLGSVKVGFPIFFKRLRLANGSAVCLRYRMRQLRTGELLHREHPYVEFTVRN